MPDFSFHSDCGIVWFPLKFPLQDTFDDAGPAVAVSPPVGMFHSPPPIISGNPTPVSDWVRRWSHLLASDGSVLDIACGQGRHMKWFSERCHAVTGIDRSIEAASAAAAFGTVVQADLENGIWPLMDGGQARKFAAVIVTNYLWRPLFPWISDSIAPGGLLIYETFSQGQASIGKPSRPEFLLKPGELVAAFSSLHIIAFEDGFLEGPSRFVQRIVAVAAGSEGPDGTPKRYLL